MPQPIASLAVVGLGTMGQGVAIAAAASGIEVRVHDRAAVLDRAIETLHRRGRGRGLGADHGSADLTGLRVCPSLADAVQDVDLVIEAVTEDIAVKRSVYGQLGEALTAPTIVATNTSAMPMADLELYAPDPARFLATHFFNPAELVPGVEVAPASATLPEVVDRVIRFLEQMGKEPILIGGGAGFVANRLQVALFLEAVACVEEGLATPEDVDRVVRRTFGLRLPAYGPFAVADMAGLDVYAAMVESLGGAHGDRFAMPAALQDLVSQGCLGLKTGSGFGTYTAAEQESLPAERDARYQALLSALGRAAHETGHSSP